MVTPGLSGLAQVRGGYDLLPKEKVALDLWEFAPMGRFRLGVEAVFGLNPTIRIVAGRFYYAQSGSRDSLAQYAVRSAFGNTENCRSSQ